MSRSKRSTSCPCKAIFKVPQKCYYYHKKKFCKWGDHCRYIHQMYMEKPKPLSSYLYPREESNVIYDWREKLQDIKTRLRKA